MGRGKALYVLAFTAFELSCGGSPGVVVGSKNFTEQRVLGEILAQQIERRLDAPVERKFDLGGTLLAHKALVSGAIDLYPEYTGTALMAVLDLPPGSDPGEVQERVAAAYRDQFAVEWLPPFGFNDTFAMVVRGADARAGGLETISDAASRGKGWSLGTGYEFEGRADGLRALDRVYQIRWTAPPQTMDLGLLYRALEQGKVTMVAANSTDGLLAKLDVKVLEDDRGAFPPYYAAVAVRQEALDEFQGLREALTELSGAITEDRMRQMNYEVDVDHRPASEVAGEFLSRLTKEAAK